MLNNTPLPSLIQRKANKSFERINILEQRDIFITNKTSVRPFFYSVFCRQATMVRAWYMEGDGLDNPRDEHQRLPPKFITLEDLYKVSGVEHHAVLYSYLQILILFVT